MKLTCSDFPRGRIVLLDWNRKLRTELTTEKLNEFTDQLRNRASRQTDALLKFAANPKFEESHTKGTGSFSSAHMTYRVHPTTPDNANVVHQYRMFSDWSARLNSMIHPGAMPPFPRLAINAALEQAGEVPETVELTIAAQNHLVASPRCCIANRTDRSPIVDRSQANRRSGPRPRQLPRSVDGRISAPHSAAGQAVRPS